MTRIIPYLLYLLLLGMYQVIWREVTSVWGVSINLAALMVLLVALYQSEMKTVWFGLVVGMVLAAGTPALMGWHALVLAALGLIAFHVKQRLNLDSLQAKLLVVLGGLVIHNALCILIAGGHGFFYLLWSSAVTGAAYSTLVAWVFFLLKEKRVTWRKVRSIF